MVIGVIADTHGIIRPQAIERLRGVQQIIHAGDVGEPAVLTALEEIAPVAAVRGNVDLGKLGRLPATQLLEVAGQALYVIHNVADLDLDLRTAGVRAVISGHSHHASIRWDEGVLFLNPGSAGPRRFNQPLSVARISVHGGTLEPEIVQLTV
jgi:putative phosphoesterase